MTESLDGGVPPDDTADTGAPDAEEAWELEIAALLSGLEPVDPPTGAIASAIDHRPLFAGRSLLGAAAAALVLGAGLGFSGRLATDVRPQVDDMADAHTTVEASFLSSVVPLGANPGADVGAEAVWEIDGQPVSMFREWGAVDSTAMADAEHLELSGYPVWIQGDVVVAQVGDSAVTLVGADVASAAAILSQTEASEASLWTRLLVRIDDATAGIGFVELD